METPVNTQDQQAGEVGVCFCITREYNHMFMKRESIVISLSSKCESKKKKELKKILRPGVSCRQAWNTISENLALLTRTTLAC